MYCCQLIRKLRLHTGEPQRWFGSLARVQRARAVQGSNSIEGFNAALDDTAAIDLGEEPLDAGEETSLAIKGYRDALTFVLQQAQERTLEYSATLLQSLHFMMTSYDLQNRPGLWRSGSMYVYNEETEAVVYEAPPLEDVPDLVNELVEPLNSRDEVAPILRAGMAHVNLVMIHPFRVGNGRMARCLQTLILSREGITYPEFSSIEEYLGRNTQAYYAVLATVGQGAWNPGNDSRPWIRFILAAHLRQERALIRRIRESEMLWDRLEKLVSAAGIDERAVAVVWDAAIGFRVRRTTYVAACKSCLALGGNGGYSECLTSS